MSPESAVSPLRSTSCNRIEALEADLSLMKSYLLMCVRKEDWHGVMDASADIREIVAKLSIMRPSPAPPSTSRDLAAR